jgi:hypothetical protein
MTVVVLPVVVTVAPRATVGAVGMAVAPLVLVEPVTAEERL